ncbi:hypothetical protein ABIB38_002808, partial [Massilia sp. UYP11]
SALDDFGGILRLLLHSSIFSKNGASTKPGAVQFAIDVDHPLAWQVVQELAHVLNYLSVSERLPTVFKPLSPPPYLNGRPRDYLSWVIECADSTFRPGTVTKWLESRLPQPVDGLSQWNSDGV